MTQVAHHWDEFASGFRQRIRHLRRRGRFDSAPNNSVGFELAKLRSKYFFADSRKQITELSKAFSAKAQMPHREAFPFPAQNVDCPLHRTAKVILVIAVRIALHGGDPGLQNCAYFSWASHRYSIFSGNDVGQTASFWKPRIGKEHGMILITGASGTAGREVLRGVAKSGAKHRAMYRSAVEATKAPPGTETVVADFAKQETLAPALRSISSVYLVCGPVPDLVELESNMIDACVKAGVTHVVLNSALGAGDYDRSFPSWHRKVEDKLRRTKLSWTILRPNSFHQNTVTYYAPSIRAQGVFHSSLGNSRMSYIDVRDVAGAVAKTLTGKEHSGKIYELNGPEALTADEVAEKIAKHSGRPVEYVDIPMEAQRKSMLDLRMPEWQVTALLDLQQYYLNGKGGEVDEVLQHLLGRAPIAMDGFLAENAAAFREHSATV